MMKLIEKFRADRSLRNAERLIDYCERHPIAMCALRGENHALFVEARQMIRAAYQTVKGD